MELIREQRIKELVDYLMEQPADLLFFEVLLRRTWNEAVERGRQEAYATKKDRRAEEATKKNQT